MATPSHDHDPSVLARILENAPEWNTGDDYDRWSFRTRSTDVNGHRERISVRFPPFLKDAMGALIAARVITEYTSVECIIRDAVYHRLVDLSRHTSGAGFISEATKQYDLQCQLEDMQKQREMLRGITTGIEREVAHFCEQPTAGSYKVVCQVLDQAQRVTDGAIQTAECINLEKAVMKGYDRVRMTWRQHQLMQQ